MQKINEAYSVLCDSEKRRQYDEDRNRTARSEQAGEDPRTRTARSEKAGSSKQAPPMGAQHAEVNGRLGAFALCVGGSLVAWALIPQGQNAPQSARTGSYPPTEICTNGERRHWSQSLESCLGAIVPATVRRAGELPPGLCSIRPPGAERGIVCLRSRPTHNSDSANARLGFRGWRTA
jgi:curved DNA-binding protein CbpA